MALVKKGEQNVATWPVALLDDWFEEQGIDDRSPYAITLAADEKRGFLDEINRVRDERINTGVEFPAASGNHYDSNAEAQKNVNGVVTMFMVAQSQGQGDAFKQEWIKQDNTVAELTGEMVVGLGIAIGKHTGLHRLHANTFKKQVEESESLADIQGAVTAYKASVPEAA